MDNTLLSPYAMRRKRRALPKQHHILPAGGALLHPFHQPEPEDVVPADEVVFDGPGVAPAGRAAQARVEHAPPVAAGAGTDLDAQRVVPPGGQDARSVAPGVEVHVHQLHLHRSADVQLCQRVPGRELQLKQMPCRPAKGVRLAFGRAGGVQIGQHGVPHMELCALAGDGIVLGPDVQPQGVGAHQRPGVQLGAAPCKCLPCAAQGKGEKQAKAEQSHLSACKHSG